MDPGASVVKPGSTSTQNSTTASSDVASKAVATAPVGVQTVTARPRFLFTAFPLLISVAAIWPDADDEMWPLLLAACGAGLVAVTALYGVLGAIP